MNGLKGYCILLVLQLSVIVVYSQQGIRINIRVFDPDSETVLKNIKINGSLVDSNMIATNLEYALEALRNKGYAAASFDTIISDSGKVTAQLIPGNRYYWVFLSKGNVDEEVLKKTGFKEKNFVGTPFRINDIKALYERLIEYYENNGFPFTTVSMDSLQFDNKGGVSASLFINKGKMILYDTIAREGNGKLSRSYLKGYLGIKEGQLYDESQIQKIGHRIEDLGFMEEEKPNYIEFTKEKARLHLFLKNKKSSRFDFLVGFLPENEITGKLIITGDVTLKLVNPFGTGKEIFLHWKRLQARTQELNLKFLYPYILSLPFGIDLKFDLYKKDTLYLDLDWEAGVQYHLTGGNYIKGFANNRRTIVLSIDTLKVKSTRTLPENIDVSNTVYGAGIHYENLDYKLNPTKGFVVEFFPAAGFKKVIKNSTITQIKDPENHGATLESLYDNINMKSFYYKIDYRLEKYWAVSRRNTIKTGFTGGWQISDYLFTNELYQIGGASLLRGFDEKSIPVSMYHIFTLEYRFLLTKGSNIYLFSDGAYVQNRSLESFKEDFPIGFGAGFSFNTKAGIFSLSYALGRQHHNPIEFRSAKIHFGYINYF